MLTWKSATIPGFTYWPPCIARCARDNRRSVKALPTPAHAYLSIKDCLDVKVQHVQTYELRLPKSAHEESNHQYWEDLASMLWSLCSFCGPTGCTGRVINIAFYLRPCFSCSHWLYLQCEGFVFISIPLKVHFGFCFDVVLCQASIKTLELQIVLEGLWVLSPFSWFVDRMSLAENPRHKMHLTVLQILPLLAFHFVPWAQ